MFLYVHVFVSFCILWWINSHPTLIEIRVWSSDYIQWLSQISIFESTHWNMMGHLFGTFPWAYICPNLQWFSRITNKYIFMIQILNEMIMNWVTEFSRLPYNLLLYPTTASSLLPAVDIDSLAQDCSKSIAKFCYQGMATWRTIRSEMSLSLLQFVFLSVCFVVVVVVVILLWR